MEFQLFNSFFLLIPFLIIFIIGLRKSKERQRLPPGPLKLPIIGNLYHLIETSSLPHEILRDLSRKYGPIMHLKLGDLSFIVVSSPKVAKEVLKTHDINFGSRPHTESYKLISYNYSDILFSPYGEYWKNMRKVLAMELFSAKKVRSFGPIRLDEGSRLIASVKESAGKQINLTEKLRCFTSSLVCRIAFGKVKTTMVEPSAFVALVRELVTLGTVMGLPDLFPSSRLLRLLFGSKSKLLEMHQTIDNIFNDIIDQHIHSNENGNGEFFEEDLVYVLLKIKESSDLGFPFTNNNIKGVLFDVIGGGTESSSTTMDWAMSEMIKNPHVLAKAQREVRDAFKGQKIIDEDDIRGLEYLKLVIKETLRLHPPGTLSFPRECKEDCHIAGYHVPKRTRVMINTWAITRNSEYWPDPDSFIPERFENQEIDFLGNHYEFLPFSSGRRICPGIAFGVANVELPLALLLYNFNWKLPAGLEPKDMDMSELFGITVSRKSKLHLVPTIYDPSHDY